jgi:hypothetical protein
MMPLFRFLLLCALTAAFVAGVREARRWAAEPDLLSARQRRLRSGAFFFLIAALALCLGGTYVPNPSGPVALLTHAQKMAKLRWLEYWTATTLLALPLIALAFLDAKETLNRAREERQAVMRESLGGE